jgi:hypothetical protein
MATRFGLARLTVMTGLDLLGLKNGHIQNVREEVAIELLGPVPQNGGNLANLASTDLLLPSRRAISQ